MCMKLKGASVGGTGANSQSRNPYSAFMHLTSPDSLVLFVLVSIKEYLTPLIPAVMIGARQ